MTRAQFEYDEVGNTFYYFMVSFYALVLIPATFYLWPSKTVAEEEKERRIRCNCGGCEVKENQRKAKKPWRILKQMSIRILLVLFWIGLTVLAYRVSRLEVDHEEYDPYAILELDRGADAVEVRKKYRDLSKKFHPDRGGDAKQFDRIAKAYQALTDEESRNNWDLYGNPDGPGATTFGIALPKWLVSKEYGVWVLAAYGFLFMVILPVGVGIWWYNSIKYSADQVLMDTTHLFYYMFNKTPNMVLKRVLMILGSSFEFWKQYNKEVIQRESDDKEVPLLIKELSKYNLGEKNKERPLCVPYSIKARALVFSHLARLQLPINTLAKDREYIVLKCPILVQEMVQVVSQLVFYANAGRIQRGPSIDTVENVMRVLPMIVQAIWDTQSPLLQLPHFTEDMLRHCITKKRRVKTCSDLAFLSDEERRSLCRNLSSDQYRDVQQVLKMMPRISLECRLEVQGEDDKHEITAGSVVTVKVILTRTPLLDPNKKVTEPVAIVDDRSDEEAEEEENGDEENASKPVKRKPWEKPKKKKATKGGNKNKPKPKAIPKKGINKANETSAVVETRTTNTATDSPAASQERKKVRKERQKSADEENGWGGSDSSDEGSNPDESNQSDAEERPEEDDDLIFDDELVKKELVLETKSKVTHPVHCPYFPGDKYEWWWVYLYDKKRKKTLIAGPTQCTTLIDEETVELKFAAPSKPSTYSFTVAVRSDSYMDCDISREIKLDVLEAREVKSHPQWDFPSEDEEHKSESEHSDAYDYTEGEDEEDDD